MWPDCVSNPGHPESDALRTALCVCVCVCERERELEREREGVPKEGEREGVREGCLYSHVSGGKFYFEKNDSHFFLGQKLLHVRGKASIPFERLSRRLYLPTCI